MANAGWWVTIVAAALGASAALLGAVTTQLLTSRREREQRNWQAAQEVTRIERERQERQELHEREDRIRWLEPRRTAHVECRDHLDRLTSFWRPPGIFFPRDVAEAMIIHQDLQRSLESASLVAASAERVQLSWLSLFLNEVAARWFVLALTMPTTSDLVLASPDGHVYPRELQAWLQWAPTLADFSDAWLRDVVRESWGLEKSPSEELLRKLSALVEESKRFQKSHPTLGLEFFASLSPEFLT